MLHILKFVIRNIKRRKLRNWLTIAGIIVGVLAIVSLISLSEGLKETIDKEFDSMGARKITITSKYSSFLGTKGNIGLTENDVKTIEKISDIDKTIPSVSGAMEATYNRKTMLLSITSYDADDFEEMFQQNNLKLLKGKMISDKSTKEIMLGFDFTNSDKADNLFKKSIDVGQDIEIDGKKYTVIGIVAKTGNYMTDSIGYMSIDNLQELTNSADNVDIIYAIAKKGKDVKTIGERISNKLEKSRGADDFKVTTPDQASEDRKKMLGVVSIVVIGIACISLLVGGIGIANSMYTSVLERKKEIGVMKAIGAKRSDILNIFLLESGIIGLIGGIFGLALGLGLAYSIHLVAAQFAVDISISTNPYIFILALGFSFILGVLSGLMPALSASKQEPVDALKEE